MNFDVQPSPEYTRLKTAADALRQQMKDLPKQYPGYPDTDDWVEPFEKLSRQLAEINAVLDETPEQKYIDQIRDDESEAWDQETTAELGRRGRMSSVLSLEPDGAGIDEAIAYATFSGTAVPNGLTGCGKRG